MPEGRFNYQGFLGEGFYCSGTEIQIHPSGGPPTVDWSHLFAAASLATIPVMVLFVFFQRQIISGLTAGAIKG